ncbi:MAG: hypothetical protein CMJ23_11260 [Phycisphaerae bacterium]|nr:hypothetical protein [Phycisphaerae bacterium]
MAVREWLGFISGIPVRLGNRFRYHVGPMNSLFDDPDSGHRVTTKKQPFRIGFVPRGFPDCKNAVEHFPDAR